MKLEINGTYLGNLDDKMAEKICEKHNGQDITDISIEVLRILIGDSDDMTTDELVKHANFRKNNHGYDTVADMIAKHFESELRPSNEICKNCDSYYNSFCVRWLVEVDPFVKGNSCWKERESRDNVTTIDMAYAEYGKYLDSCMEAVDEIHKEAGSRNTSVVDFRRPRWIIEKKNIEKVLSPDEIRAILQEALSRDPDEESAEIEKEVAEYYDGLVIPDNDRQLIKDNLGRFIEISGYLYSCWVMIKKHGIFSMRNITEETIGTDDKLIQYINTHIENIIKD